MGVATLSLQTSSLQNFFLQGNHIRLPLTERVGTILSTFLASEPTPLPEVKQATLQLIGPLPSSVTPFYKLLSDICPNLKHMCFEVWVSDDLENLMEELSQNWVSEELQCPWVLTRASLVCMDPAGNWERDLLPFWVPWLASFSCPLAITLAMPLDPENMVSTFYISLFLVY